MSNTARAIADLNEGKILATVEIKAPIERVFRALTASDEIVRWWGDPSIYQTTEWVSDLRKGGSFRAGGKGSDGVPFAVHGEYLEIDPPHTLVHTWRADFDNNEVTTVRYRLDPIALGTRVTLRHEGFGKRTESCASHAQGWELVLNWLSGFVAPPPAERSYFLCKLLPPRPTFPADMTESEGQLMQEHVAYWLPRLQDGTLLVLGPVLDPKGTWGAAVIRADSPAAAQELANGDPVVRANAGFRYDVCPMPKTLVAG